MRVEFTSSCLLPVFTPRSGPAAAGESGLGHWAMTVISMELIIILSVVRAVSGDTEGASWAGLGRACPMQITIPLCAVTCD